MPAPDPWETPECAIRSFEELTGLRVTVHELEVPLWQYLPPERFKHMAPCCQAVKASHDWACVDFEIDRLRGEILESPDGRGQQCHAGFIEWVMPVLIQQRLAWILFAGQGRPEGTYRYLVRDVRETALREEFDLPAIPETRSEVILEALRQLRSRLLEWHGFMQSAGHLASSRASGVPDKYRASRVHAIRSFLFQRHAEETSVADLAAHLGVSESRTIRLVKELFGCGFSELLNQMRLKTASSLLRNTALSVQEVCYQSGYNDLSHFHRTFLRKFGVTPLRYRRTA